MVEELGDEFHFALDAAGRVGGVQPRVGVLGVLVGQFYREARGFIGAAMTRSVAAGISAVARLIGAKRSTSSLIRLTIWCAWTA
ncbi:hypothetical protein [Streptomyces dysideae]|uniref:hypothetical protein n=1 Tax=Streptomyces dysideae TaxID=909626 RepID=UPI00131B9B16|nr:hypothetical protein [Streptomyces dysideae]